MRLGTRLRQERLRRHLSQEALAEALGISPRSIRRWEQDQAVPQGYARLHLSRFFDLSPEDFFEHPEIQAPPALLWNVPFPRNPCFTGREEILQTLHALLTTAQPVALTQVTALSGLGGIGKTQVAIEYAYRYAQEYRASFWLAAETAESLMTSLQQIAEQLKLPECQAAEQSQMIAAVQRWLATHPGWLLIGDNVEDFDLLRTVLPPVQQECSLLTTRHQALGTFAESLELRPMNGEEGVTLLLRRAKLLNGFAPGAVLSQKEILRANPAVAELVMFLDGLPLALDQAGAYIEETGCGVAEYLQQCHHQREQILARRGAHERAHPHSVTMTLRLSVEQIERASPATADLLRLCAFLHPESIPEELFVTVASHLGPVLGPVIADPYQFNLALAALRSASLVTRHPEMRTLSIHRLVQAVLQDQMEPAETFVWSKRAVQAIQATFPEVTYEVWRRCERLLPHVLMCAATIPDQAGGQELAEMVRKAADYLRQRAQYEQAEPLYQRALRIQEYAVGSDHPQVAAPLYGLAKLYSNQGKYEQAEPLFQRALRIREQGLGLEHPQVAHVLNSLGLLYTEQGRYEQAEPLFQRALRAWEQTLGPEHPDVPLVLNNLAEIAREQGRYEQAEPLYERALRIWEQALGSEHQLVAFPLNNLAEIAREQGKYEQAEPLYERALRIWDQALGPEHPNVANALDGLAETARKWGKYEQAEPLFQRALQIREQHLVSNHPVIAVTLHHLATLYQEQGKYEQAEPLYQQALHIRKQQLGPEHPETATTLSGLAGLYQRQGKERQAEPLYQRALAICEQRLGPTHPKTVEIRSKYRCLLEQRRSAPKDRGEEPPEPAHPLHASACQKTDDSHVSAEAAQAVGQQEADPFQGFLAACCELHPRAWCRASELWQAYECWVKETQERYPLSRRACIEHLKMRGCCAHRTKAARIWLGIAVVKKEV